MRSILALSFLVAACTSGPSTIPLRGPQPSRVLVVPAIVEDPRVDLHAFDEATVAMLRGRGYDAVLDDRDVGRLSDLGWSSARPDEALPLAALRERYGFEAVWLQRVKDWHYGDESGHPLVFDFATDLVSTRDGEQLWHQNFRGRHVTQSSTTVRDPFAERDPFEAADPFDHTRVTRVLDDAEVARVVARHVGARLPRRR